MSLGPEEPAPRSWGRLSRAAPDAGSFQGQRAGLVTRLAAGLIDGAVIGVALVVGYFALVFVLFLVSPRAFEFPRPGPFLSLAAGASLAFVYLTLAWFLAGRSYGHRVMGLRVLGRNGRPIRLLVAAARAFLLIVAPIGVVWVPLGRANRSLQDIFLRTEVVYDWLPRAGHTPHARPPNPIV